MKKLLFGCFCVGVLLVKPSKNAASLEREANKKLDREE